MGIFDSIRDKLDEHRAEQAREDYEQAYADWHAEYSELWNQAQTAREFRGYTSAELTARGIECPLQLKRGERLFLTLSGVSLIEPRRGGGRWEGGHQGFSIPLGKGFRYRIGGTKGRYVPNPEQLTIIDEGGDAAITERRVVYLGTKRTREWRYSKLLGYDDDVDGCLTIQVSNRQKVSGMAIGSQVDEAEFRLALALATHNEEADELADALEARARELWQHQPSPPATR